MNTILVFYAGLLYGEYPYDDLTDGIPRDLPDGAYIRLPTAYHGTRQWYRSDFTPVLLADVPKELLLLALLLT